MRVLIYISVWLFLLFPFLQLQAQESKVQFFPDYEQSGNVVEFQIQVTGFFEIEGLQGTLNWNPDDMEFVSFESPGIPALGSGHLNLENTDEGTLSIAWFNNTSTGVTIEDCASLFVVQFEVITEVSGLVLADEPVGWLVLNEVGGVPQVLPFEIVYDRSCTPSFVRDHPAMSRSVKLFPNPAGRGNSIYYSPEADSKVFSFARIYDRTGRVVMSVKNLENREIHLPERLVPGMYFIQLFTSHSASPAGHSLFFIY